MAKGNDGNYLQHSVEVELGVRLASRNRDGRLHVALTHGMAPYEACDPKGRQGRHVLEQALDAGMRSRKRGETTLVKAYRLSLARMDHYPNSATLLASLLRADRMSGGITETCPQKHSDLQTFWPGTDVKTTLASWRTETGPGGILSAPQDLDVPWLFSMDPMSYREKGQADDDYLYRADMDGLVDVVDGYVRSGQPGVVAVFVYAVAPDVRDEFWAFMNDLAEWTGTAVESCWMKHSGRNRNLCGLLCSRFELTTPWPPNEVNRGRE